MLEKKTLHTDLLVIGGGIAGMFAAVRAARCGLKVVLMHERPMLGGNASSEIRMWVCGAHGEDNRETGLLEEMLLENLYRNPTKNYPVWDTVLYDFVKREKNITLLLNCACMDAKVEKGSYADGRDTRILSATGYQLTTQTFIEVEARFFADCSGDSILAPLTGAQFRWGREDKEEFGEDVPRTEPDSKTMGMSCLITGRQTRQPVSYKAPGYALKVTDEMMKNRPVDLYDDGENFWYLELGGEGNSIADTETRRDELVALSAGIWDYVKNHEEYKAENWDLDFMGFLPGKRESRRMVGEYMMTQRDISDDRRFEDTVAYGGWPLDDHPPQGYYYSGKGCTDYVTPAPYGIPYRTLYSANVENLFFAGRNISMTHAAMSSTRVMATCGLLGEAVGAAAALCCKNGLTPNGVYHEKLKELQNILMNGDCFLPRLSRSISDLCKNAALTGGSESLRNGYDRPHRIHPEGCCAFTCKNETVISYTLEAPAKVEAVHIVFDSDLNRETIPGSRVEKYHATRANIRLDSPVMHIPTTLCRDFDLTLVLENGETQTIPFRDNLKRAFHLPVDKMVKELRLVPLSNWGGTDSTAVFSFDFC